MSIYRPKLTAGVFAASLRDIAPSLTPDLKAALAFGPLSLADLAVKAGHGFPAVASAVRSQPKVFAERSGLVFAL